MPSERPERDAERHRDHDRGERHHRALPLPEHGEVEEAERHQQGEAAAAGVVRDQRERGRSARPRAGAARARPHPGRRPRRSRRTAGFGEEERLLEQPGDRAGQLLEGEQAEAGVVAQPRHQGVDPALERHHPGARVLERPGHRLGRQDHEATVEREQHEPRQRARFGPRGPARRALPAAASGLAMAAVRRRRRPARRAPRRGSSWPISAPCSSVTANGRPASITCRAIASTLVVGRDRAGEAVAGGRGSSSRAPRAPWRAGSRG